MSALHEQPVLPILDPQAFAAVTSAIEEAFSPSRVKDFLKSVERAGLRIRNFELVLLKGLLGPDAAAQYKTLSACDQGQIRELYLATLEKVPADLREKFYKLYAYY